MKTLTIVIVTLLSICAFSCNKDETKLKPSQEYKIEGVQYTLENNDGDSVFYERSDSYAFNINTSTTQQKMSFKPFLNIVEMSHFESQEDGAFPWTEADSVMVRIPTDIVGNRVVTNDEKSPYSRALITQDSKFKNKETPKIQIPQGKSEFIVKIEYRKREVSYTLRLVAPRTKKNKIINGKWIETVPTGNYKINWK